MKRYIVFGGAIHYPYGGWNDKIGNFDKLDDAIQRAKDYYSEDHGFRWCHIVDLETWDICWDHWELRK